MRHERHTGAIGDFYLLDEKAAEYSLHRRGNGDYPTLEAGDLLMRSAHAGDCFSRYVVFRGGVRQDLDWAGYDGVGEYVGNAIEGLASLPEHIEVAVQQKRRN